MKRRLSGRGALMSSPRSSAVSATLAASPAVQRQGQQQAAAPHRAVAEIGRERLQSRGQVVADLAHAGQELRLADGLDDRAAHRGHERVAVERAALVAGLEAADIAHSPPARPAARRRRAPCRASGCRAARPRARSAQKRPVRPTPVWISSRISSTPRSRVSARSALQVVVVGRNHAGLALDRLEHDGGGALGDGGVHGRQIVQRHLAEARHLGLEERLEGRLARGRHGGQRAAVEGCPASSRSRRRRRGSAGPTCAPA